MIETRTKFADRCPEDGPTCTSAGSACALSNCTAGSAMSKGNVPEPMDRKSA